MTTVYTLNTRNHQASESLVEVTMKEGIGIHLVGLPDMRVKECLLRTITALQSLGYRIPGKKIVIDIKNPDSDYTRKYDLPIAVAILQESGQIKCNGIENFLIAGELGLDASVRPIWDAAIFGKNGCRFNRGVILPDESAIEAAGSIDADIYSVLNLNDVIQILNSDIPIPGLMVWNSHRFINTATRMLNQ